ncbi:replication protein C, IncQ-type [Cupriavidus sp.]|uniref:replication protein C, IncQ-type n=1 Tax=Cupriavidus sp. TaxID=1873897 RepID=UPI0028BF4325|nr:replication protein C, IncQ-type [Cupriavidus sp.]
MRSAKPTHAKFAQPIVHAHGLFRSLAPGERRTQKLDVTYAVGDATIRFVGFEPLDSTDLRVLQAVVALATSGLSNVRGLLRDGLSRKATLEPQGDAQEARTVAARFTLSTLAETAGFARGGSNFKLIRASLLRLSNVTVHLSKPAFEGAFRLIGGYGLDKLTGELIVSINPVQTDALLGRQNYLRVNMDEVRKIQGSAAHLLHSRLHWLNQGDSRAVSLDTLCSYVYEGTGDGSTMRKRRKAVRRALEELVRIGWAVMKASPTTYRIHRPARTSH